MTRTRLARIAAAGALTCALVAGGAAASFAADTPQPTAGPTASSGGHPQRCTRAEHADKRVQRALARIQADASHQGSLAWLQARAADADKAGKTQRADALRARATRRENRVPELTAAQQRLKAAIANRCTTSTPTPTA